MLLADMGAEVVVVDRSSTPQGIAMPSRYDINARGKKSIALDVKKPEGLEALLKLVDQADVLVEGYRPGVAEKLGFGPDVCQQRNPGLIYGRMTGWGQTGPLAGAAGHDINYIALTGSLAAIGGPDKPVPPLNLVGDYAGGSLFLVMGILAALFERQQSGKGQVVDAAIVDGSASLMSIFYTLNNLGLWSTRRGANMLDGAAHFYDTYETSDGKFISIGSIEPQFYALLLEKACLDPEVFREQGDASSWPELKRRLVEIFKTRSRDEWCELMEGTDVCFAPVLDFKEAPQHPHNVERSTYIEIEGLQQPAPAPRFSRSVCDTPAPPVAEGADTEQVLEAWGFSDHDISHLRAAGALG
jgi:alpha-methylacyl-CoA racemase